MAAVDVRVSVPRQADLDELVANIRAEDAAEVQASHGGDLAAVVAESVATSEDVWVARFDGRVACLWGVVRIHAKGAGGRGVVWLLTTLEVERHKRAFLALCRDALVELTAKWAVMINAIDMRHEKALRWAERLGFAMCAPVVFGVEQRPFVPFAITRELLNV